jgi:hypothetical protein
MNIEVDNDVKAVLEFMQERVAAFKLIGVAERIPAMAKLLWDKYPQEPVEPISLRSVRPLA